VYRSFGWRTYRKIGADVKLTSIYRSYQVMVSLIKVDLQFGINLVIVAGFFLYETFELYIDIGAIIVNIIWAGIGWLSVRVETKFGTIFFLSTSYIEPGYVIYKIVHYILTPLTNDDKIYVPLIYYFGAFSIFTRIILVIWTVIVMRHFKKGLKKIFEKEEEKQPFLGKVTHILDPLKQTDE